MTGESILELHETNATDECIKSYEYDEYQPITGSQLNSAGQITITIENQDQFLHLHNSYLLIEGNVLKADDTRYADADLIALTNNGLLYLFPSLKLTLAGQTVEHVNYPGHATSLLGLPSYSSKYYKGCGLAQGWFPDVNTNAAANNTGFYLIPPHIGAPFFHSPNVNIGLTSLTTPIQLCVNESPHVNLSFPHIYIGVVQFVNPIFTFEECKKGAPICGGIGYTRQGYLIRNPNPKGSFQCAIPMRHIFGFVDDCSKVTYGMRDTLQLIRKDDNDALFRTAAAGAGKVVLSKLAWSVPIVQPNDVRKVNLYKSIGSNNVIPVSYCMPQCETFSLPQARSTVWRLGVSSAPEKTRWVLVGLQTNKSGIQENNAAIIDHCNLTNMQVWLNHSRYPSVDMATDFTKEQYAGVYKSFYDFLADTMG